LVSGVTWKILAPAIAVLVAVGGTALTLAATTPGRVILTHLGFKTYQFNRIDAWLHPFDNTASTSLQLSQSLKAIGSGQLFGKGFNQVQVHVPVRESDMIFSVIGENFGSLPFIWR
ncbi:MAG: FtsW/RodA/SpoVE family cell cycle protein, partial [Latilactobacillus curvatus]